MSLPGCGGDPRLFLPAAAAFANDRCFGTLSCALFVHPAMQKEHPAAVDAAIAELRYGSVCVNCPTTLGFGITKLGWGAHASGAHSLADIGSGNCIVHNTLLFDRVQKSVLRAPWRPMPMATAAHAKLHRTRGWWSAVDGAVQRIIGSCAMCSHWRR